MSLRSFILGSGKRHTNRYNMEYDMERCCNAWRGEQENTLSVFPFFERIIPQFIDSAKDGEDLNGIYVCRGPC